MTSRFRMAPATLGQTLEIPLGRRANPVVPSGAPERPELGPRANDTPRPVHGESAGRRAGRDRAADTDSNQMVRSRIVVPTRI